MSYMSWIPADANTMLINEYLINISFKELTIRAEVVQS